MPRASVINPLTGPHLTAIPVLALAGFGLSLALPLSTLAFLLTGPHSLGAALLWTLPVWALILADIWSPPARDNHPSRLPNWFFDGLLYLLGGLQIANIVLMLGMVERLRWDSFSGAAAGLANLLAIRVLVGTTSCCSGIAVAHEMIHRRSKPLQWLVRPLLCLVCYDHFAVAHIRGHHRYAGTERDHATARFGESYREFFRRTVPGQFKQARSLEDQRLGLHRGNLLGPALLRHQVLQGVFAEALLIAGIGVFWGGLALAVFLWQALAAVRLLEAVNYFQHWGLTREGKRFRPSDTWVTDSWVTLHVFLGLSRHADHHTHAHKPYYALRSYGDGPRLPYGYFGMAILAKSFDTHYRTIAAAELRSRNLGPFTFSGTE